MEKKYWCVGQNFRKDGKEKVKGETKYAGDIFLPDMLFAKPLLAPVSHGRLKTIDTSLAKSLPGVVAVVTAEDIKGSNRFGPVMQDQPVLVGVGEDFKFLGDTLALVAAENKKIAEEAIRLIKVDYEELPGLYNFNEALADGAFRLHQNMEKNICSSGEIVIGDITSGFNESDIILEEIIQTPRQEHAYLETEAAVSFFDNQGRVNLYSCLQDPYYFNYDIAQALGLPANRIRTVATTAGGAFGGKDDITLQAHAILLTLVTGRPVKMVYSREESILIHPKRHPSEIRIKIGATKNGRITAFEGRVLIDAGAYTGRSPVVLTVALNSFVGPYYIPHIKLYGHAVYTNNLVAGACRGYGQPQSNTARELVLDMLADRLNINPVTLRKINALKQGQQAGTRLVNLDTPPTLDSLLDQTMAVLEKSPHDDTPAYCKRGTGVACAMPLFDISALPSLGLAGTGVAIQMHPDGSLVVYASAVECGQGVISVLAQIAAEEFSVNPGDVEVILADTDSTPKSGPTTASRQTYTSGNALKIASEHLKKRLISFGSRLLNVAEEKLYFYGGKMLVKDGEGEVPLSKLAKECYYAGVNLKEEAWFRSNHATIGHTFIATAADVEVDTLTGSVKVLKLVTAHDIGKAINPLAAAGQIIGGGMQSLGWAMTEDLMQKDGMVVTPSLAEYLIPTALDLPAMETILMENPYPTGPYGAKGVGEHASMTAAAAILNAIYQATGKMVTNFPATPEKVFNLVTGIPESS
ncbi:MAG: xanthine dehydrogenase family protein molybdopterin-binding subunit [Bacillota bacterium]